MLDVTVLGTFVIILTIITLWVIKLVKRVSNAFYAAFLPSSRDLRGKVIRDTDQLPSLSTTLNKIRNPWGWSSMRRTTPPFKKPNELAKPAVVPIPWGWPGGTAPVQRYSDRSLVWRFSIYLRSEILAMNLGLVHDVDRIYPLALLESDHDSTDDWSGSQPKLETAHTTIPIPWGW